MTTARHSWGAPERFAFKTERECRRGCGVIKVTRHEGGRHWVEYWRDGDSIGSGRAPICEASLAAAAKEREPAE